MLEKGFTLGDPRGCGLVLQVVTKPLKNAALVVDLIGFLAEAVVLAASPSCPVEAFRWKETAYGIRFHLEATEGMVRAWRSERYSAADPQVFLDHEAVARRAGRLLENFLEVSAAAS